MTTDPWAGQEDETVKIAGRVTLADALTAPFIVWRKPLILFLVIVPLVVWGIFSAPGILAWYDQHPYARSGELHYLLKNYGEYFWRFLLAQAVWLLVILIIRWVRRGEDSRNFSLEVGSNGIVFRRGDGATVLYEWRSLRQAWVGNRYFVFRASAWAAGAITLRTASEEDHTRLRAVVAKYLMRGTK